MTKPLAEATGNVYSGMLTSIVCTPKTCVTKNAIHTKPGRWSCSAKLCTKKNTPSVALIMYAAQSCMTTCGAAHTRTNMDTIQYV